MQYRVDRGKQVQISSITKTDILEVEHKFNQYGTNIISQPHEWKFIYMFYRNTLIKHQELIYPFLSFCYQYYPNYHFSMTGYSLDVVLLECNLCDMLFEQYYKYKINVNLSKPLEFGNMITEFMIRYLGYSLIGFSEQKIILTSQSNCEKRFQKYLEKDYYTIFKLARLIYKNGIFEKLPVFPTKETYLQFDEYIEDKYENKNFVLR